VRNFFNNYCQKKLYIRKTTLEEEEFSRALKGPSMKRASAADYCRKGVDAYVLRKRMEKAMTGRPFYEGYERGHFRLVCGLRGQLPREEEFRPEAINYCRKGLWPYI